VYGDRWIEHLADSLSVGELPDLTRHCVLIRDGIEVNVHESLRNGGASLWVVAISQKLWSVDIVVQRAVDIDIDRNVCRKVELGVESAGTVAALNAGGSGKLPDICGTGCGAIQTLLNAVALILNQRKSQVDLGDDTGHVEASDISYTSAILDWEISADTLLWVAATVIVITIITVIIVIVVISLG